MLALIDRSTGVSPELDARPARVFPLAPADRDLLARWTRAATTPQRVLVRSAVVLLAAGGHAVTSIADEMGLTRRTVALWQRRFLEGGPQALLVDAPGRGRKKGRDRDLVERIVRATRETAPATGERWTVRSLGRHLGVSHASVHRVWRECGLAPGGHAAVQAISETVPCPAADAIVAPSLLAAQTKVPGDVSS